jgi:hypothetical protein
MFWFKKNKIVVDAFTDVGGVFQNFPIQRSSKFIPDWWKSLPGTFKSSTPSGIEVDLPTMKSCVGMAGLYKSGFVVPLWSDLIFEKSSDNHLKFQFAADLSNSAISGRPITAPFQESMGNIFKNHIPLKINTPWMVREKEGINFYLSDPIWNKENNLNSIRVLPGIINFKYQTAVNANILLSTVNERVELNHGEPLIQLIPLSDRDIDIRCHLVTTEELEKMNSVFTISSFGNRYSKIKKVHGDKCPLDNFENTKSKKM